MSKETILTHELIDSLDKNLYDVVISDLQIEEIFKEKPERDSLLGKFFLIVYPKLFEFCASLQVRTQALRVSLYRFSEKYLDNKPDPFSLVLISSDVNYLELVLTSIKQSIIFIKELENGTFETDPTKYNSYKEAIPELDEILKEGETGKETIMLAKAAQLLTSMDTDIKTLRQITADSIKAIQEREKEKRNNK